MTLTSDGDRDQLVSDLEQARTKLHASFQGLSSEEMIRSGVVGEWSVKDVLSHLASWEEFILPDLARLARGDTPTLASVDLYSANYDGVNSIMMSLRRNLPLDQVVRELETSRAAFMAAIGPLPASALAEGQFGRLLLRITAEHDSEHGAQIHEWRRKEGS